MAIQQLDEPSSPTNSHSSSSREAQRVSSTEQSDLQKEWWSSSLCPSDMEASTPSSSGDWKPQRQEYLIMFSIAFISLVVALDATILVSALPTLAVDLHGYAEEAFWAGTSYLLSSAVFQPFVSDLSEIFGRQQLLQASIVFFTTGSIICARAGNFPVLLAGRCLKGIGGGGIITMGQVIFADIVPLRQRAKWFALVLVAWALGKRGPRGGVKHDTDNISSGSVLGPLVGGLLVEHATWTWCFYINLPFCGIGLILVHFFVRFQTNRSSLREKLLRVDWVGGCLFISSLTSFLMGISWAGVQFPWSSFRTITPIVAGALGVLLSLVWERYGARQPFLRKSIFHSWSAIAAFVCALCQGLVLFLALYYAPFYFMAVHSATPTESGINLFPVTCFLLPGAAVVSVLISRLGRFRWALYLGWTITTLGSGLGVLMAVRGENIKTAEWVGIFIVFGLGNGIVLTSVNFAIQSIARTEDCARAAGMYAFFRTLGMTIGVAVGGTVFQNMMSKKLVQVSQPTSIAHHAEGFIPKLKMLRRDDPSRDAILQAYNHGFLGVYVVMTAISALGLLSSLVIRKHSMDKILETKHKIQR
jgi:MFS family permease